MLKLRAVIPYFIMIACPLLTYYFLLQEHSTIASKSISSVLTKSTLMPVIKTKQKFKVKSLAKNGKLGDFSEQFFQELRASMPEDNQDLLRQLLVLEPLNQSTILSLKDETLSWLSTLNANQRLDVLHILQQQPSGEWQENLDSLQKLSMEELQSTLSQRRLAQKATKENLEQRSFDTL